MSQMDPWSTGTPAYRAALLTGMGATFVGIVAIIIAALSSTEATVSALRTTGLVLIGIGVLSHLVGIGLRRRQAVRILREKKSGT